MSIRVDYLVNKGWKCVKVIKTPSGETKYWTHVKHQNKDHKQFTTDNAFKHQKYSETHGCGCVTKPKWKRDDDE